MDDGGELAGQFRQIDGRQVHILSGTDAALDGRHGHVERLVGDAQSDLAEQLDEAPVRVMGKALIAGLGDQALAAWSG